MPDFPAPKSYTEVRQRFGNITVDNNEVVYPRRWESNNIVSITTPDIPALAGRHILCHRLTASALLIIFEEIAGAGGGDLIKSYDGCYNPRLKRGSHELSLHSWGIAIDLNADENELGTEGNMPELVKHVFRAHGWHWGGDFQGRKDPMHFQYAEGV